MIRCSKLKFKRCTEYLNYLGFRRGSGLSTLDSLDSWLFLLAGAGVGAEPRVCQEILEAGYALR